MVSHGITWYHMVSHGITWYHMVSVSNFHKVSTGGSFLIVFLYTGLIHPFYMFYCNFNCFFLI